MECDRCGSKGFRSGAGFASHKRSCWQMPERFVKKSEAAAEGSVQSHTTVEAGTSVHSMTPKNDEVAKPKDKYSHDSTMLSTMIDMDSPMNDSTQLLVDWIQGCNDGKGLPEEATKDLLDLLSHPQFDPKALEFKNSEELARYEKEHEEELKAHEASLRRK
ncbi:hypothetical protein KC19_11G123800 [Ceratodon purpureus]|uniref:Uncharacterized protein n=1 Tax=Ceratodon purpureus TaxID=3225 RepID=A0A8T0GFP6_CERPU|nr:hypothetical protein KC19_11G123800 [Ceratodon purpureus]